MRKIGDSTLARLEGSDDHEEDHDGHHVLGLDHEGQGEHEDLAIPIQHAEGDQQPVNSTRRPYGYRAWPPSRKRQIGDRNGSQPRAHHTEQVELEELLRSPILFLLSAKHPKHEHIDEHVPHAPVQESVGDELKRQEPAISQRI